MNHKITQINVDIMHFSHCLQVTAESSGLIGRGETSKRIPSGLI